MKPRHRNPIIAACVGVVFLGFFIGTLFVCVRRFNKESIARRAREAQLSAAQAVSRQERRRARGLDLPEAEEAPTSGKYKGPALGNVVIKDPAAFLRIKDELVEVEVPEMKKAEPSPAVAAAQTPSATTSSAVAAAAAHGLSQELSDTFGNIVRENEPLSPSRRGMTPLQLPVSDAAGGEEAPSSESLAEGGFVIVVCGEEVGGTSMVASAGTAAVAAHVEAPSSAAASTSLKPSTSPTIHIYRHQPSRSFYGESRYTDEVEASVLP